jgi:hypothetical protein
VYALIEQLTLLDAFPLTALCETLEVSRAGYYAWLMAEQNLREQRDRELMPLVCDGPKNGVHFKRLVRSRVDRTGLETSKFIS